ncbi:hypothetical protein [Streptomyces sp. NBC_00658]|uniref:hypothetical protein n=1 Tax=Streptomyces sp. NBC_00658 TaxID=2975800 RepID=UPI00324F4166
MNRQPELACWGVWSRRQGEVVHAGDGLDCVVETIAVLSAVRRVSASTMTCTFAENR